MNEFSRTKKSQHGVGKKKRSQSITHFTGVQKEKKVAIIKLMKEENVSSKNGSAQSASYTSAEKNTTSRGESSHRERRMTGTWGGR